VLTRHRTSEDAEIPVLRHENAVLHRQIGRVRCEPADRLWLARCAPGTVGWSRKWDYASRRGSGRPSTAAAIRKLMIRIATENPGGAMADAR
jgi:hypothetical protein